MDLIIFEKVKWNISNFAPVNGLVVECDPLKVFLGHKRIDIIFQLSVDNDRVKFNFKPSRTVDEYEYQAVFITCSDFEKQWAKISHNGESTTSNGIELADVKELIQNDALNVSVEFTSFPFVPEVIPPTGSNTIGEVSDVELLVGLLESERHSPNVELKHHILINLNNALDAVTAPKIFMIAHNYGMDKLKAKAMAKILSNVSDVVKAFPPLLFWQDYIIYCHNKVKTINTNSAPIESTKNHEHKSSVPINSNFPPIISVASTRRTQHNRSTQTPTRIKCSSTNRLHQWGKFIIFILIFFNLIHLFIIMFLICILMK